MPLASQSVVDKNQSARSEECLCCQKLASEQEWGLVSLFLAERAFQEKPTKTRVFRCGQCGFAWSERGLTSEQANRLYEGYREEAYFEQRHRHEPWYGREKNKSIGSEPTMVARRLAMEGTLKRALMSHGARAEGIAVDFGGDKGQMLKDFPDAQKWVYEYSGVEPEAWAKVLTHTGDLKGQCDIALCCQVLEHVEAPAATAFEVAELVKSGGWVYLEVPDERWVQSMAHANWRAPWLDWVLLRPSLHKALDFISTASRIAVGWIPPFGFWSMREHINFFTPSSLRAIADKAGIEVVLVEANASGLALVGVKR
jgi:hypothetical protein